MRFLLFLCDGRGFVIGLSLLALAAILSFRAKGRLWPVLARATAAPGLLLVIVSGTPLPLWFYALWISSVLAALSLQRSKDRRRSRWSPLSGSIAILCCLAALWHEWLYLRPSMPAGPFRKIYVIGDSLSSGIYPEERTWPKILREEYRVEVVDLSRGGDLCSSALAQAEQVADTDALVLIEIGGNDLLTGTPTADYETALQNLLAHLQREGRAILMFELPILPLHNRFGEIQRRLAAKYGVTLIPKHYLTGVLGGRDATVDGIHLSPSGHRQMAEVIWGLAGHSLAQKK